MDHVRIDRYVVETLMPDLVGHDKRPSAFLVYLFLLVGSAGSRARTAEVSLREIADGTGLSKRGVQDALRLLERRRLVGRSKGVPTGIVAYEVQRPWRRRR